MLGLWTAGTYFLLLKYFHSAFNVEGNILPPCCIRKPYVIVICLPIYNIEAKVQIFLKRFGHNTHLHVSLLQICVNYNSSLPRGCTSSIRLKTIRNFVKTSLSRGVKSLSESVTQKVKKFFNNIFHVHLLSSKSVLEYWKHYCNNSVTFVMNLLTVRIHLIVAQRLN